MLAAVEIPVRWVPWILAGFVLLLAIAAVAFAALPRRRASRARADPAVEPAPPEPVELSGDVTLAGVAEFPRSLRVRGSLTLREDARIVGNVEVDGDVLLATRAAIDGALVARGRLELRSAARTRDARVGGDAVLARDAVVQGKLSCERLLILGARDARESARPQVVRASAPAPSAPAPPAPPPGSATRSS